MLKDIFFNPRLIAESEGVDYTTTQKAFIRCRVLHEIFYLVNNTSSEEHESMLEALDLDQGLSGTIKQSINTFQTSLNMTQFMAILKHPGSSRFGKQEPGYLRRCLQVIFSTYFPPLNFA